MSHSYDIPDLSDRSEFVPIPDNETADELDSIIANAAYTNPNPSEAQKAAGNYAKRAVSMLGFNISVENEKGGIRSGTDKSGIKWSVTMPAAYGYIKGTEAGDGDHVDVYLNEPPVEGAPVFIIDQVKVGSGEFDEPKCFLGFPDIATVTATYHKVFSDGLAGERMGGVSKVSLDEFKQWLKHGDLAKPFMLVSNAKAEDKQIPFPAWAGGSWPENKDEVKADGPGVMPKVDPDEVDADAEHATRKEWQDQNDKLAPGPSSDLANKKCGRSGIKDGDTCRVETYFPDSSKSFKFGDCSLESYAVPMNNKKCGDSGTADGNVCHAGLSDEEHETWEDYSSAWMAKEISKGNQIEVGSTDIGGNPVTKESVAEATAMAQKLQRLASTRHTKYQTLYRGEVLPTEDDISTRYRKGEIVTLDGLTATSHNQDLAKVYTDGQFIGMSHGEGAGVLLRFGTNHKSKLFGYDKEGNGTLHETILPSGYQFKVAQIAKHPDGITVIDLYRTKKQGDPKHGLVLKNMGQPCCDLLSNAGKPCGESHIAEVDNCHVGSEGIETKFIAYGPFKATAEKTTLDMLSGLFGPTAGLQGALKAVGAQSGDVVRFEPDSHGLEVMVRNKDYDVMLTFDKGDKVAKLDQLYATNPGARVGTKVFARIVDGLSAAGFTKLRLHAKKGSNWNGYYTWPRLGAKTDGEDKKLKTKVQDTPFSEAKGVEDLMGTPEGRAWWREHGHNFNAYFDLAPTSQSMKTLKDYLKNAGL